MRVSAFALLALHAAHTAALEVRFQPADVVYVWENVGEGTPKDLYTAVVQNIALLNEAAEGGGPVTLERVRIDVEKSGDVVGSQLVDAEALTKAAQTFAAYAQAGVLAAYDFQFQTSRYLAGVGFPAGLTLAPGEAIVLQRRAFLFTGLPDALVVTVEGRDESGAPVSASGRLAVVDHHSPNEYSFPVRGTWIAGAAPSLHSHHRWGAIQEFALDLVQIGEGGITHTGDGSRLDQYYAYGQPVYAVGDGTVVAAKGDSPESDQSLKQPGESGEAYFQRSMAAQQGLLAQGFAAILGNHVVIEHPHGEFSMYVHLQPGSVSVAPGDEVTRGQLIGRLGHSGNSTEPHLHFHVTDGPDLSYSRSLPVEFSDIALSPADDGSVRHLHSGQILVAGD
jgi:murein DD-endopeptidase MepM/ murein hydrolase activator NlpD